MYIQYKMSLRSFEWDPRKNAVNLAKHGIAFEEAKSVFGGPNLINADHRRDYGEERLICVGRYADVVLAVVFTERNGAVRLISARRANRHETQAYFETFEK